MAQEEVSPAAEGDVDMDLMSSYASRTTLAGMQQLWRQHAAIMDGHGKQCAEQLFLQHSQALQDLAGIKQFDLKPTLVLLNTFVGSVRENVLAVFVGTRQQDDAFAQQLYQTTRIAFTRNLKAAMEARDAWYQEKIKALQGRHQASLNAARTATAMELRQARMLAGSGPAVVVAPSQMPTPRDDPLLNDNVDAAAAASAIAAAIDNANGTGITGTVSTSGTPRLQMPTTDPELVKRVEALHLALQESARELASWRSKWAVESTKADSVKRECMQVVLKCEDHVTRLQQQHVSELSQRDYILQRCKDTITNLEARLAGDSHSHGHGSPAGDGHG